MEEVLRLGVDPGPAVAGFGAYEGAAASAGTATTMLTGLVAKLGLTYLAFTQIRGATKDVIEFDSAMTQSLAIMADSAKMMRGEMSDAARKVGVELNFAAKQGAEAFFFLASAGFDAEQSIAALPAVAQFAKAGMFDFATATSLAADAQSALGLKSKDAQANLAGLTRVTDVLVKANTLANANVQQFSEALTRDAGAAMKSFGMDVEEGTAVLAAFADQGIKGDVAGSSFGRMLRLLTSAAVKQKDAMNDLGIAVFDDTGNMRNMADVVGDLENALIPMSDEARVAALAQVGFSARVQGVIMPLLGTSEAIRGYEKDLRDAGGTTKKVSDEQMQSLENRIGQIHQRFQQWREELTENAVPAFESVIENIDAVTDGAIALIAAIGVGGAVAAFLSLAPAVWGTTAAFVALIPAIAGVGDAVALLEIALGPAGWFVLGVTALAGAIYVLRANTSDANAELERHAAAMEDARSGMADLNAEALRGAMANYAQGIAAATLEVKRLEAAEKQALESAKTSKSGMLPGNFSETESALATARTGLADLNTLLLSASSQYVALGNDAAESGKKMTAEEIAAKNAAEEHAQAMTAAAGAYALELEKQEELVAAFGKGSTAIALINLKYEERAQLQKIAEEGTLAEVDAFSAYTQAIFAARRALVELQAIADAGTVTNRKMPFTDGINVPDVKPLFGEIATAHGDAMEDMEWQVKHYGQVFSDAILNALASGEVGFQDFARIATVGIAAIIQESDKLNQSLKKGLGYTSAAVAGAAQGYQSASPGMGALQGGVSGFAVAGPVGGLIGAVSGLVGGLFGQAKAAKEAARQMALAQAAFQRSLDDVVQGLWAATGSAMERAIEQVRQDINKLIDGWVKVHDSDRNPTYWEVKPGGSSAEQLQWMQDQLALMDTGSAAWEAWLTIINAFILKTKAATEAEKARVDAIRSGFNDDLQQREADLQGERAGLSARLEIKYREEVEAAWKLVQSGDITMAMFERLQAVLGNEMVQALQDAEAAAKAASAAFDQSMFQRGLTAVGRTGQASDAARQYQNAVDYQDAVKAGRSPEQLQMLLGIQGIENEAAALDRALADQTQAIKDAADAQVKALNTQIQTAQNALAVAQSQLQAQEAAVDQSRRIVESLGKYLSGLVLGKFSPLSPMDRLAEARRQFEVAGAAAMGGDAKAAAGLTDQATTYLDALRLVTSSTTGYAAGFIEVQSTLGAVKDRFGDQLSTDQMILAQLRIHTSKLQTQIEHMQGMITAVGDSAQAQIDLLVTQHKAEMDRLYDLLLELIKQTGKLDYIKDVVGDPAIDPGIFASSQTNSDIIAELKTSNARLEESTIELRATVNVLSSGFNAVLGATLDTRDEVAGLRSDTRRLIEAPAA